MIRLFVGFPLPASVRHQVALLASGLPGARWSDSENYHLTLRFIGEVDEGTAEDIDTALLKIDVESFDVTLSGIGYFGKPKAARALWVGVAPSEPLLRLRAKIETALQRIGLPAEERKFTPHVTLAKLKGTPVPRLETYVAANALFMAGPFTVSEFTLYSSFLSSSGAIHTPEAAYALG